METQVQSDHSAKSLEKNLSPISLFKKFLIKPFVFAVISSSCQAGIFQALSLPALSPRRGSRAALSVQQKVITHCADFTAPARDVFWGWFSDYFTESSRKPDLGWVPVLPLPPPRTVRGGRERISFPGKDLSLIRHPHSRSASGRSLALPARPCLSREWAPGRAVARGLSLRREPSAWPWDRLYCGAGMGKMGVVQGAEAALSFPRARLVPPGHLGGTCPAGCVVHVVVGVCPSRRRGHRGGCVCSLVLPCSLPTSLLETFGVQSGSEHAHGFKTHQ